MLVGEMTKMYTIDEAAKRLHVSYRTVYNWIKDQHIFALKKNPFGKRIEYLIPEYEVERVAKMQRGE